MNYIIVHINMIIVKTVMKDKVQFVAEDTNISDGILIIIIINY